ncbi:MAG: glycosyltransferase family 2 protein [Cryomorphaceae bacterium]
MTYLSVVIPIHNEEENLPLLASRLGESLTPLNQSIEVILVNDGSEDDSLNIIKSLQKEYPFIHYLSLSRNFGHQNAMCAGLDYAKGELIIVMDGDLQDPPEVLPEMISKAEMGFKVVYAKRRKRKNESFFKKFAASTFYRTMQKITSLDMPLDTGDFRLIHRDVLTSLQSMGEYNKFLRGQISWLGFSQTHITFDRDGRKFGETSYTISRQFNLAMTGVTSFSDFPLKMVTYIGFIVSLIAMALLIFALIANIVFHATVSGWSSLMIAVSFLGGIQMLSLGIIGSYISRINQEVRKRPLYIVEESSIQE